jgi:exocyst complex component 2
MELTFIQKSLGYYGRETPAGGILEDLYSQQITHAYSPLTATIDTDFKTSFNAMQKTLADARKATAVQFLCFRQSLNQPNSNTSGNGKVEQSSRRAKADGKIRKRNN